MQLIVHFGTYKTGTTSIQQVFFQNQAAFLERGVFYPKMPPSPAHHLLTTLYREQAIVSLLTAFDNDRERVASAARRAWEDLKRAVADRKPDIVVLSSELFLSNPTAEGFARFRALLQEIGAPVTACAYIRAPAPYYLSFLQQRAKISGVVLPPEPLQIRRSIEMVEAAFGQRMVLRAFAPGQIVDGDVVKDFASQIVGCAVPDGVVGDKRFNETVSAETMAISVANRRANCAGKDDVVVPEHRLLLNLLRDVEPAVGGSPKPRLKPEVVDAVTRASQDLIWLRDDRGIAFDGIDYASVDGRMPPEIAGLHEIDQICEVDAARREALLMHLVQVGATAQIELARVERILPVGRILSAKRRLKRATSRLTRLRG